MPIASGLFSVCALTGLLLTVDAFSPETLPQGFESTRQLIGINLLLILLPSYMVCAWGLSERRSWHLLGQIDAVLPQPRFQQRLRTPPVVLVAGGTIGMIYAVLFNLPVGSLAELISGGPLLIALVACMILVWVSVGVVLSFRIYVSRLFLEAGRVVPIDLYHHTPLEPFARSGMGDLLLAVGALALTTVQSIDATIRPENYLYALVVALPASLILLLQPMASVHARLRERKRAELAAVNALIAAAPKSLDANAMAHLELLLARRERAHGVYTWPVNVAMFSRILLYGVIPPVAWIAAALVEQLIESMMAG